MHGTTFKALRTEQGYGSARKLARRLDTSPMTVLGWDQGAEPGADNLIRLAEVLNTSPAFVLRVIQSARRSVRRTPTEAA